MSSESGWKGLGLGIAISDIPLMIALGYFIGRQLGREQEGVALGALLGVIVLSTFVIWVYKKSKAISSGDKSSQQPTTERQTP